MIDLNHNSRKSRRKMSRMNIERDLPIGFPFVMISTNRIGCNAILAWRDVIRLKAVAVDVLNSILTASIRTVADHNSGCTIEAIFQIVTNQSEIRQAHPTRFHRTWSWHTVAFAFLTHFALNMLFTSRKKNTKKTQFNKSHSKRFYSQDETAKNWHYSCTTKMPMNRLCVHECSSCRVHKTNPYIISNSTKCLHFVGITLFSCSQQIIKKNTKQRLRTTTKQKDDEFIIEKKKLKRFCCLCTRHSRHWASHHGAWNGKQAT